MHLKHGFEWDDLHWDLLDNITSLYLKEIRVYFSGKSEETGPPVQWEKVDDLLCQFYDRSYDFKKFQVSLGPNSGGDNEGWIKHVGAAWPKFSTKGAMKLVPYVENIGVSSIVITQRDDWNIEGLLSLITYFPLFPRPVQVNIP